MFKKDIIGALVLLALSIVIAFCFNHFYPNGIAYRGQWESAEGVISAKPKNDVINPAIEITEFDLIKKIVHEKRRIILDVRPRDIYRQGHLPGALSFPLENFDDELDQLFNTIQKQTAILVYCSSVQCPDAHTFASLLAEFG
ncbi:MAG: rhodanese-like domain-containing protein, partial [Desulfobacteraceae bacterium]|nr:rhodanese-like domain-containing protein [Desulfobacteraceae bacterium]